MNTYTLHVWTRGMDHLDSRTVKITASDLTSAVKQLKAFLNRRYCGFAITWED